MGIVKVYDLKQKNVAASATSLEKSIIAKLMQKLTV